MGGRRNKTFSKGAVKGLTQLSLSKTSTEGAQLTEGEDSLPVKPWKGLLQPQLSGQPSSLQVRWEPWVAIKVVSFKRKDCINAWYERVLPANIFNKFIVNTVK